MNIDVRPYTPADRADVLAIEGDARALDSEGVRVRVARDDASGALQGWGLWYHTASGHAHGVAIAIAPGQPRQRVFELLEACVEAAQAEGIHTATIPVRDGRLARLFEREMDVVFAPSARNVKTGENAEWSLTLPIEEWLAAVRRPLA